MTRETTAAPLTPSNEPRRIVNESVSLLPTQSSPVVGWNANVRGCARGAPTSAPAPPAGTRSLRADGVPDPNAGAHALAADGFFDALNVFTSRLGLISAAGFDGATGHASSVFKSSRSTVFSSLSSPVWSGSAGSSARYVMQWSTTAYAGCTAASKNLYTSDLCLSSTTYGNPPFVSDADVETSEPLIFAHASATPSLTPFFSDAMNATLPEPKKPAATFLRREETCLVKEG
mmetsp:Transcript_8541/g.34492  ORF Transcript_8541/g.34492 Transcript_8541/m.34492 type:complete len:232 (-) Transcript_8541:290-985(-)